MPDGSLPARGPATLPARIQHRLAGYYGIEDAPAVDDFVEPTDGARESLLVREEGGELEVAVRLPRAALEEGRRPSFDELCQVVEGVSHFLYLAERARRELPATQLELELQAEVDKYVLFAHGAGARRAFHPGRAARLKTRLYERVAYLHPAHTETGARYRMANELAARFAGWLDARFAQHGRFEQMRAWLRRFYGAGQAEKIGLARAA
jgi:hypothetical protein